MKKKQKTRISIVMGSQSDWETLKNCEDVLKTFNLEMEKKIISAHRTPERLYKYASNLKDTNIKSG